MLGRHKEAQHKLIGPPTRMSRPIIEAGLDTGCMLGRHKKAQHKITGLPTQEASFPDFAISATSVAKSETFLYQSKLQIFSFQVI